MVIETKSSFLNHLLLWVVTITIFGLIFMPFLMKPDSFEVTVDEVRFFHELGRDTQAVTAAANSVYQSIFNDSGASAVIDGLFHKNNQAENERAGIAPAVNWARKWVDNFTRMIYRGIWRQIALWPIYLSGILSFCIPAIIDGLVMRAKKKFDFMQSNPVFFYGATHAVSLVLGMGFVIPIAPIPINSVMITSFFCVVSAAMWVATSNLQTGQ